MAHYTIKLKDGIKIADYAPNKEYEITAIVDDADEAKVREAVDIIKRQGDRFLGRAPAAAQEATQQTAGENKPARRAAKDKDTSASATDASTASQVVIPGLAPSSPQSDASAVTPPKTEQQLLTEGQPAELAEKQAKLEQTLAPENDPLAGTEPEGPKISDVDLNDAVAKRRGALGEAAVPKLRALVETFNPNPGTPFVIRQIAQEQRAKFLADVAALKV
jgi:hypothetical protein